MPSEQAGVYQAQIIGTRDNVSSVVQNIPRQSPLMATEIIEQFVAPTAFAQYATAPLVEYETAPAVVEYVDSGAYFVEGGVVEMIAAPTFYGETLAAPTFLEEVMVAPTLVAPTV